MGTSTQAMAYADVSYSANGLVFRNASTSLESVSISRSGYGIEVYASRLDIHDFRAADMLGDSVGSYAKSVVHIASSTVDNVYSEDAFSAYGSSTVAIEHAAIRGVHRGSSGLAMFGSSMSISDGTILGSTIAAHYELHEHQSFRLRSRRQ